MMPPPGLEWLAEVMVPAWPLVDVGIVSFYLACCCSLLGLFTAVSTLTAATLGFFVLAIPQLYGKVNHHHFLLWFLVLLATSPCGLTLSLDAAWARRRGGPRYLLATTPSPTIRWAWLLLGGFYFSAGFWKLMNTGPAWISSGNLRLMLFKKWLELGGWTPSLRLDRYSALLTASAVWVLVFELGFVFAIVLWKRRSLAAIAGLLFHWSTFFTMRIMFLALQMCYVCFVDWRKLVGHLLLSAGRSPLGDSATPSPTELRRAPWVGRRQAFVLGSLLFVGNGWSCVMDSHGWPFSGAPHFGYFAGRHDLTFEIEALDSRGASRVIGAAELAPVLGSATIGHRVGRTAALPDGEARDRALRGLVDLSYHQHPELRSAQKLRVWRLLRVMGDDYPPARVQSRELVLQLVLQGSMPAQ
jgi:hypothetical protein